MHIPIIGFLLRLKFIGQNMTIIKLNSYKTVVETVFFF